MLCRCVLDEHVDPFHRIARRRPEGLAFGVSMQMVLRALVQLCVLLQLLPVTVKSCDKILRSGRALTVLCGEEGAQNAEDARSTKCRPFIPPQPVEEVKGFGKGRNLFVWRSFPSILTKDELSLLMAVSADGFRFKGTSSVSAAEQHFPATTDSTTK